jgi:TetR/AcrR family transcriptional regulator, cholesterol catabolism regulator
VKVCTFLLLQASGVVASNAPSPSLVYPNLALALSHDSYGRSVSEQDGKTRQRIIEVATSYFAQHGFQATSMKAIAAEVGISPPAIYWHFQSKQDLFLASMEYLHDAFVHSVECSLTADEPAPLLRQFVRAHVLWKLEQREAADTYTSSIGMRDLVHWLPPKHRRNLVRRQRNYLDRLRRILSDGVTVGVFEIENTRTASFAILTMCDYVQGWFDPEGDLSPEEVADHYANLVGKMVSRTAVNGTAPAGALEEELTIRPARAARRPTLERYRARTRQAQPSQRIRNGPAASSPAADSPKSKPNSGDDGARPRGLGARAAGRATG